MKTNSAIEMAATWLGKSSSTVVFSGAGMSTESGLPDFRSQSGLWTKFDPMKVATVQAMTHQYELFHEFYKMRIEALSRHSPHTGHEIIAEWERIGLVKTVATQNVDGFHQKAGSQHVFELHGSLSRVRCINEAHPADSKSFIEGKSCSVCGSRLRPGVVLFGENLPAEVWNHAFQEIKAAQLLIVIGTSLQVSPVNQLPSIATGKKVLINQEPVNRDDLFDLVMIGKAGDILQQIHEVVSGVVE
jgi:NAD-dependent deacetylase